MRVALLTSFDFQMECITFLLEIFKEDTVTLYTKHKSDKFQHVEYCQTLYFFTVVYDSFNNNSINESDLIVKLSSNDPCSHNNSILSIVHLMTPKLYKESCTYISLTVAAPYITAPNVLYIFPIYNPPVIYSTKKVVSFIGFYAAYHVNNDMIQFIQKNSEYFFLTL